MFREIILPIFRSTRLCVTACGVMHPPRCCRPKACPYIEDARCLKVKPRERAFKQFKSPVHNVLIRSVTLRMEEYHFVQSTRKEFVVELDLSAFPLPRQNEYVFRSHLSPIKSYSRDILCLVGIIGCVTYIL